MEDIPKIKRGRGRPRKTPLPPPPPTPPPEREEVPAPRYEPPAPVPASRFDVEELIHPDQYVDTKDIARAMPPPPPMPERVDDEELIRLPSMDEDERGPGHRPMSTTQPVYSPPPPPAPPVEDAAERKKVLTRIRRYRESFDAVRAMSFNEEWSLEKLNNHLDAIRTTVGSKTTHVLVKHSYLAAVKGIEVGTCAIQMKTYGLTDLISKSAEIDSILKEVAAEMGIGAVPPAHRLALATIGAVLQLDSANRKAAVLAGFKAEPVNEAINLKFGD